MHLACSASDSAATEYVRLILGHPGVNVNIQDAESHWTALHRALYNGNLTCAMFLLQRSDTDVTLKDYEGYTAIDLYNSTIEHSKPSMGPDYGHSADPVTGNKSADLFTWGANRNAVLGSGSADDRTFPEPVVLRSLDAGSKTTLISRLTSVHARQVVMSKLHTAVVTTEDYNNIRVCGFGSGGRLGSSQHTQYDLIPITQLPHPVSSVALGQDHTLALTKSGEVFSWGLNRFAQLGYIMEQSGDHEQVQVTPKRIAGPLKHKVACGVAACKTASACFTSDELYTWGTNNGQLGYDKAAHSIQVLPRLVARITHSVIEVVISDSAMACLLSSKEVICLWNDRHSKINFQIPVFPLDMIVYHPSQAVRTTHIAKITCCDNTFGALSHMGEVFIFTPSEGDNKDRIKPQRIWALKKQSSAVKDFALGSDGSIIICTESGHVFVRSRNLKGPQSAGKTFKFQRIPMIQRVVRVCANNTGAFGALKVDFRPEPIKVVGNTLAQDLRTTQPFLHFTPYPTDKGIPRRSGLLSDNSGCDTDASIQGDIENLVTFCDLLSADREARKATGYGIFDNVPVMHGSDLIIQAQTGICLPVHRMVLSCRSSILGSVLSGVTKVVQDKEMKIVIKAHQGRSAISNPPISVLTFTGCQPLSILIFLTYLYSDQVPALWDPRVWSVVGKMVQSIAKVDTSKIKSELLALARVLRLPLLVQTIEVSVKKIPTPSMVLDLTRVFDETQILQLNSLCKPDVVLNLADRQVFCHSVLLRARSSLFAAFFNDDYWTINRWRTDGTILVDLKHLSWRAMQFVVRFLCCGEDEEMFEDIVVTSIDELLDLVFDVMAAANELLIDRLVLICSAVILRHVNINNVCSVFSEATHYTATALIQRVQKYMVVNMETLLENRMLDDLNSALIKQLSNAAREEQARKSPYARSTQMIDHAMALHADWLALQDIPQPIIHSSYRRALSKESVKLSHPGPSKKSKQHDSPLYSPMIVPLPRPLHTAGAEDIFAMDDDIPSSSLMQADPHPQRQLPVKSALVWRALEAAPRTDMKTIMAEAENQQRHGVSRTPPSSGLVTPERPRWSPQTPQRAAVDLGSAARTPPGPVWKVSSIQPSTSSIDQQPSKQSIYSTSDHSFTRPDLPSSSGTRAASTSSTTHPPAVTQVHGKGGQQPGLGPVFNPPRQSAHKSITPRRVSGTSSAWSAIPSKPVVNTSPGAVKSFVAIQLMQQEEDISPLSIKQSLKEIQEEERAQKAEQDFLKWWANEEERLRLEREIASDLSAVKKSSKRGKSTGQGKGVRERGDSKNLGAKIASSSSVRG